MLHSLEWGSIFACYEDTIQHLWTHHWSSTFCVYTLRPRQNGRYFADDIFKCIFVNENARILLKISLKFVHKVRIDNIPVLVQIMAWRRPGDKPLSEPMMVSLLTHTCVTRPQNVFISWKLNAVVPFYSACTIPPSIRAGYPAFPDIWQVTEPLLGVVKTA